MRIAIFQIDTDALMLAGSTLIRGVTQDVIPSLTVAALAEAGLYRQAFLIETAEAGELALEQAFLAASDVAGEARILSRADHARQPERSDVFVTDAGATAVYQGTWFSPHVGPAPAFPRTLPVEVCRHHI